MTVKNRNSDALACDLNVVSGNDNTVPACGQFVAKITFADKVSTIISSLPIINRIRAEDVNEIKSVVNENADHMQEKLTAGNNIVIDDNNEISENIKYSTTEKVVGTWIDNRPLYQKTIVLENTTISSSTKEISILDITNNDVVMVENMYINCDTSSTAGNRQKIFESFTDNNGHYVNVRGWQNNLLLQTDSLYYINKAYITIEYTKTAD